MHLENKPKKANNQTKILGDWLLSTQYVLVIVLGCLGCKIHPFYLVSSIISSAFVLLINHSVFSNGIDSLTQSKTLL